MQVSSQLVHLIPKKNLRLSHLAMASPYVSDRVCERLLDKNQLDLRNFLVASTGEIDFAVLRGNLFESYTHVMYQRGGTFKVRYLDTGVTSGSLVDLSRAMQQRFALSELR